MNPPSDLELMMYFDGELDEPRRAEVEAFLRAESTGAAPKKLFGLGLVAEAVRSADASLPKIDLTSAVMAAIEREPDAKVAEKAPPSKKKPKGEVVPLAKAKDDKLPEQKLPAAAPANENGRFILGLAGVAAAAAAALFLWGRSPEPAPLAANTAANTGALAPDLPASALDPVKPSATVAAKAAEPVDEDRPPPVEVASVDFGNRTGAIYYVAGDSKETKGDVTTVVWIADE